jgi:hypothetical protein
MARSLVIRHSDPTNRMMHKHGDEGFYPADCKADKPKPWERCLAAVVYFTASTTINGGAR